VRRRIGIAGLKKSNLFTSAVVPCVVLQIVENAFEHVLAVPRLNGAVQHVHQGDQFLVILVEVLDAYAQILRPQQQHESRLPSWTKVRLPTAKLSDSSALGKSSQSAQRWESLRECYRRAGWEE